MKVSLSGVLRAAAGGAENIEIEATTIRDLMDRLLDRYPAMQEHVADGGIAVSIDGQIYRDTLGQPIPEGAEVFLLPRLAGG